MNTTSEPFVAPPVGRQLCRLCLGQNEPLVDIFSVQNVPNNGEPLTVRIHGFLQLEIAQNDSLPKWICKLCLDKVNDFFSFRERCRKNERELLLWEAASNQPKDDQALYEGESDEQTDDEETEMIVIDPSREYESSNDSLPNDSYGGKNGNPNLPPMETGHDQLANPVHDDDGEASEADEGEEEEEEDDDEEQKCDTMAGEATRNGLSHTGGSTNSTPQKTVVHTCKYCDVAFAASSACQLHEMQDHDLLAPYGCMYCNYKTSIRMFLITHIRDTHGITRPYICIQCNKGFLRRSDLKKHTFVHTGVRPYACEQCGKSFSRNTNLKKHLRTHLGLKPHACEICPRSFANKADLVRHRLLHLEQEPQFSCIRCGAGYTRKDRLYEHERFCSGKQSAFGSSSVPLVELKQEIPFTMNSTYPDEAQPLQADDPERMASLMGINPPNFTPVVPSVSAPAATPPSSKIYSCTKCPKRFLSKVSLRAHQTTHPSEDTRQYECSQCKKHLVGKVDYDRHMQTHTEMKPFGCGTCDKRFSRRDKLHRHERIHQRERQYACPNCAASFAREDALASHLKIHCMVTGGSNMASIPPMTIGQGQGAEMPMHQHSLLYSMLGDDALSGDPSIHM